MKSDRRVRLIAAVCLASLLPLATSARAATVSTNFDDFANGTIDGQQGWRATNPNWDQAIVDLGGGNKVWRVSNEVTGGSFGDMPIAPGTDLYAGESGSTHLFDGQPAVTNRYFASFQFRSATGAPQAGLRLTISPDDGGGSRQSFIGITDNGVDGFNLDFFDSAGNHLVSNPNDGFVETIVATSLSYGDTHTIAFDITFVDGNVTDMDGFVNGNDIVKVYVDGALVHTGTTWESYFTTTTEGQTPPTVRAIDTLLFRISGTANPGAAGNGLYIDNVYISDAPPPVTNVTSGLGYTTIQAAVDAASANDVIEVAAGTYPEDVTVTKTLTIVATDGPENTTVIGPIGGGFATFDVNASGSIIDGFTITRDGNDISTWNDALNSAGVSLQGAGNIEVRNCIFSGNRSAIDINNSAGNNVHHNRIDFNHTGIILRNGCPGNIIANNEITNNRSLGVVWLGPPFNTGDATGCSFTNNKIEGNWYAQIENRTIDGGIKDFSGNWLGTDAPTVSADLAAEPGYADLIPVEYGGNKTPPVDAQPTIRDASALYDYSPWLASGADSDSGVGFEGDYSVLNVDDDSPQSGAANRIQEGIDLTVGSTVNVLPGVYPGNISVTGGVTLQSTGGAAVTTIQGAGGSAVTIDGDNVTIEGFTVENPTGVSAIHAKNHSVIAIRNNIVTNVGSPAVGGNHHAVLIESSSAAVDDVTIEDNQFFDIFGSATTPVGSVSAITVGFSNGDEDVTNLVIQNNTISNVLANTADFAMGGRGAYGILLNHAISGDGQTVGALIQGNAITDLEGLWAHGIGLEGDTPNAVVEHNDISNLIDHKMPSDAIGIQVEDNPAASTMAIHYNSFTNLAVGIQNITPGTVVNAENNFWGSNTGPADLAFDASESVEVDLMSCTGNPSEEFNADGTGSAVNDDATMAVDYCPWLLGQGTLSLQIADACPDDADGGEAGYQIAVELWMHDLLDPATGFQAFVTYDTAVLTYRGDLSSYSVAPYPQHISPIAGADLGGVLSLNGFTAFGPGGGTSADSLLATLVFDVDASCQTTSFGFDASPASELSFEGNPLVTGTVSSPTVTLDDDAPVITPGMIADCYPTAAAAEADAEAITSIMDNCAGALDVTYVADGTCAATVTATATDACGNVSIHVYNTRIDGEAPVPSQGAFAACYETVMDAEAAAIAATSGADNCTDAMDLDIQVVNTTAGCDIAITVRVTDECGNFDDVIYNTRVDNEDPTVTAGPIALCYPTVGDAEAAAVADAMATAADNCDDLVDLSFTPVTVGDCSATITVTITDSCGNATDAVYNTRIDNTPPVVTCSNVAPIPADAGLCTALVVLNASATDNCDGPTPPAEIVFTIDADGNGFDGMDPVEVGDGQTYDFPAGVTSVRASATDDCGNVGICDFTVTVDAVNVVNVVVELPAVMYDGNRTIRFTAKGDSGCAADVCWPVTFTSSMGGSSGVAAVEVPCGDWTALCAKDEQHTLIDTVAIELNGVEYDASGMQSLVLISGDTDNDSDVDINDVTLFIAQFNTSPAVSSPCPFNNVRNADFSLDGLVDAVDYSILQPNWLQFSICDCTPVPVLADGGFDRIPARELRPVDSRFQQARIEDVRTRIRVSELRPEIAVHADLNGDGEFSHEDLRIFEDTNGLSNRLSNSLRQVENSRLGFNGSQAGHDAGGTLRPRR